MNVMLQGNSFYIKTQVLFLFFVIYYFYLNFLIEDIPQVFFIAEYRSSKSVFFKLQILVNNSRFFKLYLDVLMVSIFQRLNNTHMT